MLAVWIIAAVLIFLLIISLIPINAVFTVSYSDGLEGIELFVKFLFIKIPVFPKAKKAEQKPEKPEQTDEKNTIEKNKVNMIKSIRKMYRLLTGMSKDISEIVSRLVSRTIEIKNFAVEARIGTEDAMFTGMTVGAANGFIYSLIGLMDGYMKLKQFSVSIEPDWNNRLIDAGAYIKLYTNIFNIAGLIPALVSALFKARKLLRED
ncbi:MAG: DUF2953 domain-containing protein [bacterium]|nr:DUF2953 domain-containing protein [bacterium]